MDQDTRDHIADLIIDGLGGTVAVAKLCEIDPSAVSQWRWDGIPRNRLKYLRLARPKWNWSQVPKTYRNKSQRSRAAT
jgi:hypothetical protein